MEGTLDEDFNMEEFLASESAELVLEDIPTLEEEPVAEEAVEPVLEPELLDFAEADAILADLEKEEGESGVVREKENADSWDTPVESVIKKQTPSIFDAVREEMRTGATEKVEPSIKPMKEPDAVDEIAAMEEFAALERTVDSEGSGGQVQDAFGADFFMDDIDALDIETLDIPEMDGLEIPTIDEVSTSETDALGSTDAFNFENADLADLLAGSSSMDDGSIEEISSLLNMDENNEAVNDDMMDLLQSISDEAGSLDGFDALSMLSAEEEIPAGGKKKKKKEKKPKKEKAAKKEKEQESGEKKPGLLARILSFLEEGEEDETDTLITSLQAENDAILLEMGGEDGSPDLLPEKKEAEPEKEEEIDKKEQEKKEKQEQKEKKKKEKQEKKEQKKKERQEKREKERQEASLRAQFPTKKAVIIFVVCIMLMLAFLTLSNLLTSYSIKQNAIDAYYAEDYLQCYELLYGQERSDSEDVMYHRSEIYMKMQLEQNRYTKYLAAGQELEAVDQYVQFLVDYPDMYEYSLRWQAEDIMEDMYLHVTETLFGSYGLTESEALEINALRKDEDYTRALTKVVEGTFHEKPVEEPTGPIYEDLLPEEEVHLGITGE